MHSSSHIIQVVALRRLEGKARDDWIASLTDTYLELKGSDLIEISILYFIQLL